MGVQLPKMRGKLMHWVSISVSCTIVRAVHTQWVPIIIQGCLHSKYVMKSVQNNEGNKSLENCKGHEV